MLQWTFVIARRIMLQWTFVPQGAQWYNENICYRKAAQWQNENIYYRKAAKCFLSHHAPGGNIL